MLFLNKKFFIFSIAVLLFNTSFSDEFKELVINGSDKISSKYIYNELKLGNIKKINKKIETIRNILDDCNFIEKYNIKKSNNKIVIDITEAKLIKKIKFNGNKKLKEDDIKKIISTTDNSFLDKNKLNEDIEKLKEVYKSLGLLTTNVSYKI